MTPGEVLRGIIVSIVQHPDAVSVVEFESEERITLELTVHSQDKGGVIGIKGDTADSLRTVMSAVGGKLGKKIVVKINDDQKAMQRY